MGKLRFGTSRLRPVCPRDSAAGLSHQDILQSYPALIEADIEAALSYAAELTREGTVTLPLETRA
ncbi:MAG: hypothetical protein DMG64_19910 [Acidobacteria bacterium]|nr:MAG: hypothetical protein DMG64_19910 [Acidobacteriota bacterium]